MRFAHVATAIVSLAGLPLALAGPATDACGPNFCQCCFYSSPSESYYGFYHTSSLRLQQNAELPRVGKFITPVDRLVLLGWS
ncbi:unnamed protein product [Zymoseptoria tritici ST99CH_1A5]|uniref:CBM1 domain-containing protein n=1 Tax=Zymoseptoria tritici ST99CH_1A5 TaxID=1276529 RepID=A0A1Y6LXJ7_ZYMTR|nr:unnamed protein product [Zymoseptoria tritici ST99CH_1A5]